jgi:hypothetical protein
LRQDAGDRHPSHVHAADDDEEQVQNNVDHGSLYFSTPTFA